MKLIRPRGELLGLYIQPFHVVKIFSNLAFFSLIFVKQIRDNCKPKRNFVISNCCEQFWWFGFGGSISTFSSMCNNIKYSSPFSPPESSNIWTVGKTDYGANRHTHELLRKCDFSLHIGLDIIFIKKSFLCQWVMVNWTHYIDIVHWKKRKANFPHK
jgi:hypothetical protein